MRPFQEHRDIAPWDVPILAYHQIPRSGPPKDHSGLAVPVMQFERQMRYLHDRGYRCLSLMELVERSSNTRPWPRKTVILTFDDGYEDFAEQAYPILRRYGFTATVFLVTDLVGKQSDWEGESGSPLLTWEQVRALHRQGISFGSHTRTHPSLPRLSLEQVWVELVTSKERLEAKLGQEIQHLAYPHGASNREIQSMARAAGYQAALGVDRGRNGRFDIWRRLCSRDDGLVSFMLKLTHGYQYPGLLREKAMLGQLLRKIKHGSSL